MTVFNIAPEYYLIMVHSLPILPRQSSYINPELCEKLNLKSIASRDVTIKVFGNQVLQEKLDYARVCLKSTDNENIVINCLVKDICQPLHGQDLLHAKQKLKHLKN